MIYSDPSWNEIIVKKISSSFYLGARISTINVHTELEISFLRCSGCWTRISPTNTDGLAWEAEVGKLHRALVEASSQLSAPWALQWLQPLGFPFPVSSQDFIVHLSKSQPKTHLISKYSWRFSKRRDINWFCHRHYFASLCCCSFCDWSHFLLFLGSLMAFLLTKSSQSPLYYISMLVSP